MVSGWVTSIDALSQCRRHFGQAAYIAQHFVVVFSFFCLPSMSCVFVAAFLLSPSAEHGGVCTCDGVWTGLATHDDYLFRSPETSSVIHGVISCCHLRGACCHLHGATFCGQLHRSTARCHLHDARTRGDVQSLTELRLLQ